MNRSQSLEQLATALAAAQGQMAGALKDSENPFYQSRYADLASVWKACRKALADNQLSVVQSADAGVNAEIIGVTVTTLLIHSSGQWIESELTLWPKDSSPQAVGSAISYARRYSLAAMVGVYQADDDAERAQDHQQTGFMGGLATPVIPKATGTAQQAVDAAWAAGEKPLIGPKGMNGVLAAIEAEDVKMMRLAWNDATGLGTVSDIWRLLNTKQKKLARELLGPTMPKVAAEMDPQGKGE